ncbi:MAG: hypothetical protein NC084_06405 [Bacteroides sp.]|nr:hypothetical protein [Eubacterium sp.]MCM1418144.1 hypothetical protein [Roseburia sp.]MCM1462331.1 hypothetical protein [Bacteroides sp.]
MSYRSDVTIACGEKAYSLFLAAIQKYDVKPTTIYKTDQDTYILQWEWWKWSNDYSGVGEIDKIMRFLDRHFVNSPEYSYHFMRIGEEYSDIDDFWNGDYLDDGVEIVREVHIPNRETLEEIFV